MSTRFPSKKPDKGWKDPLWERQTSEGDRAFEAFSLYRDMGPGRSAVKGAEALGKSTRLIARWSTEWGWVERASAWDDEADRLQRERDLLERQEARSRMLSDHVALGRAMTSIAAKGLAEFSDEKPFGKAKVAAMSAVDLARLAETGAKMERLARGETTERIEVKEAMSWVEGFLDLALEYLPVGSHEAFLVDVDQRLGVGGMSLR